MKQTRRKELKTNELSLYLQQIRESAVQYSNYIIGALVVVVIILIIGLSVQRSRVKAETDRWREFRDIQTAVAQNEGDPASRASALADQTAGDAKLGPLAMGLYGDILREKAMTLSPVVKNPERDQLLEKARGVYEKMIQTYSNRPEVVSEARMKLASVAESLYVDGKGDLELARKQYEEVIKNPQSAFRDVAQRQLDTLAERTQRLEIVASRPAESAPAPATTQRAVPTFTPLPDQAPRIQLGPSTAPAAK